MEKVALEFDIAEKNTVKELTELAIVMRARDFSLRTHFSIEDKFKSILDLYNSQVTLSHRTSQSMLLQQYSTPAPLSYLAGIFCEINKDTATVFEPSAGNGLLTVAANPKNVVVNEVDSLRRRNLQTQGYKKVLNQDATKPFIGFEKKFDAVLTNPPFGTLDHDIKFDTFPIRTLDHLMALRALDCMKDSGKAAIIIGGHTKWDDKGRIQAGRNRIFFNYLYSHYNVVDVIQIDGHKLYSRQGTAFHTRLILIHGRKKAVSGVAPVKNPDRDSPVRSYQELYERIMENMESNFLPLIQNYRSLKKKYPDAVILLRSEDAFYTFENDAIRVAKILNTVLTNVLEGKNLIPMTSFTSEIIEVMMARLVRNGIRVGLAEELKAPEQKKPLSDLERDAEYLKSLLDGEDLGAPYQPASASCVVLNTQVPDSMSFEIQSALERIKKEVGGDIDAFVRHRLGYPSKVELCKALSAEQIDAVAMAIYNIEAYNEGMIIGDQTGIGKGRIAASIVRYAVKQGLRPVFLTEKANLFSDLYRDLVAIGSGHLLPFIINARESKTDIKDEDGEVIHTALSPAEQKTIFESEKIPARYDFEMGTYSQFNSPEKKPEKPAFLMKQAGGNIFILDEAHNSSGSSNTGEFLQRIVSHTKGVVFLSATFAKRPDNMPIYAMKTAISEANMSRDELVDAINQGGVALQEVMASQLVAEGQMIRRERSFEGVEVNYMTLTDHEAEHRAIADNITEIVRDIIAFQSSHVDKQVEELDKIAVAEGKEVELREGTSQAGVDNQPYFSKVFQVINQMLFSIKAEAVADRAIQRLKEGKKPVIAFASTMGSFIEDMENDKALPVGDGDVVNADFAEVLRKGLDGILRYTEKDVNGEAIHKKFALSELPMDAQIEYNRIWEKIKKASTGITISPIDVIIRKLTQAGYSVAEVTGRKYELQINPKTNMGLIASRKRINTNDAFRQFNNNEVDVLMINQSGSTGASAHAIPTSKIPADKVQQRVMIVLQAELDINTEVQKRGRINRTGQILKPIYDYVNSAIPAEMRLMMMLQKKLKSLDANTTSNQKQSTKILDVPDFLNKYGDKVVKEYLLENPKINDLIGDPLHLKRSGSDAATQDESRGDNETIEDAAHRVSGRVAVLSTSMQQDFYNEISERYSDYVEYLKQISEYDLEVETMNLQTETVSTKVIKAGKGGRSAFGDDSILETVRANVLKKPFSKVELENILRESMQGLKPEELKQDTIHEFEEWFENKLKEELLENENKYNQLIVNIPNEKKLIKIREKQGEGAFQKAIKEREEELSKARVMAQVNLEKTFENRRTYLLRMFKFFHVGRKVNYPVDSFEQGQQLIPSVFVGFAIDKKKKNPFAPSAIKLRFAISNSSKYIAIPASYSKDISSIIGASMDVSQPNPEALLEQWEQLIKESTTDRKIRHIITGNLLQAFSDFRGKLVSYTTLSGETKKGILMPENWSPAESVQNKVVVPIYKALSLIKSLANGAAIYAGAVALFRHGEGYKILVPSSRSKGGDIYLDSDLLSLVERNNFEKTSDKMVAFIPFKNIEPAVKILQDKFGLSVTVSESNFESIRQSGERTDTKKKPVLLPPAEETTTIDINMLELEAEALLLMLELEAA
ncbi:MAG: strawberry notch C-terminal domain-containing protein [Bacteroidota bacterium]